MAGTLVSAIRPRSVATSPRAMLSRPVRGFNFGATARVVFSKVLSMLDALIIGGGPSGLMAAIYLARYRRKVLLIDEGASRAALIPESHRCSQRSASNHRWNGPCRYCGHRNP